jgi:peptidyl-prolyl cis-trans isomerase B (cyclophilin B)
MRRFQIVLSALVGALLSVSLSSPVAAQDAKPGLEVTLAAETLACTPSDTVALRLRVVANRMARVSATLLGGLDLECEIDGTQVPVPDLLRPLEGEVVLAEGTTVERRIEIDLSTIVPEGEHRDAVFRWRSASVAVDAKIEARVRFVPDQSGLDVDALDLAKTRVRLVTSKGEMVVSFLPEKAPNTVRNFVKLSKNGFYNQTRFHRVIRGFMIQGGDPNTKPGATGMPGTGTPGYFIDAEFNDTRHVKGVLSMARSANPNSAGCQFFICHANASHLDNQYTAFGKLVEGFDVLDAIATTPVGPPDGQTPVEPVWVYAAIVETDD